MGFSESGQKQTIEGINTISTFSTIVLSDCGFTATVLLEQYRLCIVICISFVHDWKFYR